MTAIGWLQILVFFAAIVAVTKPLGVYMFRVFEGDRQPLPRVFGRLERLCYRLCGVDPRAGADLEAVHVRAAGLQRRSACSSPTRIQRLQHVLPLNPQHFGAVEPTLGLQHRRQLHHQHQLAGYRRIDDELPDPDGGAGLAQLHLGGGRHRRRAGARARLHPPARARRRRRRSATSGSTSIRGIVYVLLPLSIVFALVLVSQGVIQNLSPYLDVTTLEGAQADASRMGPVASQEAIKKLGTNGGGFFNANAAHPFENPTPFTNFLSDVPDLRDPGRR